MWNSLEIAKLSVGALTPFTVAFVAWFLTAQSKKSDYQRDDRVRAQAYDTARYAKLIEKRLALWDEIGPPLNSIYAYELEVGDWLSITAKQVVGFKRAADKVFYSYRLFFSDQFSSSYDVFMDAAFKTFNLIGQDARLRTSNINHQDEEPERFTGESNQRAIYTAYFNLLKQVGTE